MRPIKRNLFLITLFCAGLFLAFGGLALMTLKQSHSLTQQIQVSTEIIYLSSNIHGKHKTKSSRKQLKEIAIKIADKDRSKKLSNYLSKTARWKWQELIDSEGRRQRNLIEAHRFLVDRTVYFASIALIAGLFLTIFNFFFARKKVLTPLNELDHRMKDFLDDRYSYEFSMPENNEVGDLHNSFNELAQKVVDQIDALQNLDKAKTEFLSIASHELRTPLTSIKGSLSLLQGGVVDKLNPQAKDLFVIALNETDRLIRLINELLDLAKIEARQFPLEKKWASVSELVSNTKDALNGLANSANVTLNEKVSVEVDALMDSDRIQQVLTNLASNAIKFSPEKSTVTLSVDLNENNELCFSVSDQGRGIPPEDQELIFEKFRQATSEENPLVKGTGLGLAIAKALVEQHGGEIGVTSEVNKGSTFWFTLVDFKLAGSDSSEGAA